MCEWVPAAHDLTGCDTTCSMNRIGKKTAYSKLLKNVDTLSNLKTFHEDDLEHSVAVARSYALLLYGKTGSDMDTLDELCYIMATTTDKSVSRRPPNGECLQTAHPSSKIPKHGFGAIATSLTKRRSNQLAIVVLLAMMEVSHRQCSLRYLLQ